LALILIGGFLLNGCECFIQASKGETALAQPSVMLKDVNFDFDKYHIRSGDAAILKKDAESMRANSKTRVKIEGHCDERGTVEYNLVLGRKRADAARNYLVSLGMNAKAIDTLSYGKERPPDPGRNEAAWAKNRTMWAA
jgi:peptidoglycan-associated lipoprotein